VEDGRDLRFSVRDELPGRRSAGAAEGGVAGRKQAHKARFLFEKCGDAAEREKRLVVESDWRGRPEVAQRRVALLPTSVSEYRGRGPACAPRACPVRVTALLRASARGGQGARVGLGLPFARCQPKRI